MTAYVCTFIRNGEMLDQAVHTKPQEACECLVAWARNAARCVNLGICDFEKIEREIRNKVYSGNFEYQEKVWFCVDEDTIYVIKQEV